MLALHDEARRQGARLTNLPLITSEVLARIPSGASERAPARATFLQIRKLQELATRRWRDLEALAELADPQIEPSEIDSARGLFRQNQRSLQHLTTREKNPIPEDSDLQIMLQLSRLDPKPIIVMSRDAHFVGYADLIRNWYQLEVVDALRLPLLLEEWRSR